MSPAPRRAPAAPPKTGGSVNFGEDTFYSSGGSQFDLPPDEYAVEFNVQNFIPKKKDGSSGNPFLAVVASFYPISGGDPIEKPLGCGSKAMLSFVPSADGKGFEAIPGGNANTMNGDTNWNIFRKSLLDCGMELGTLTNDLSVIDGIWIRTANEDEPESRKQMKSRTGEAADEAARNDRPNKVVKCVEILEGGKPWEGGGGFEGLGAVEEAPAAPAKKAGPPAKAAPAPKAGPAKKAAPAASGSSEEDIARAAETAIIKHLDKPANRSGCSRVGLKVSTFGLVQKAEGDDMAQAVIDTVVSDDDKLNLILGGIGYALEGDRIVVAAEE